jgi:hypothetical protein
MNKISLLVVLALLSINSYAQGKPSIELPKNVIHGSIGTFIFVNSAQLTYDRLLKQSNSGFFKSYYLTLKAGGHASIDFSGNDNGTGYVTSLGFTALTGNGKNHFEVGLGLGYFMDSENSINPQDPQVDVDESSFYPNVSIGYRKQTSKGFMFRTGLGVVEWAYVGVGFSF